MRSSAAVAVFMGKQLWSYAPQSGGEERARFLRTRLCGYK